MKLLADENIERAVIARLRSDGHEVVSIAEETPGLPDRDVLLRASQLEVVLVTGDKDFGELVYRHQLPHAGILLLRLPNMGDVDKCDLVSRVIAEQSAALPGAFSVLSDDLFRVRRPDDTHP